jgi:hypothetical protein
MRAHAQRACGGEGPEQGKPPPWILPHFVEPKMGEEEAAHRPMRLPRFSKPHPRPLSETERGNTLTLTLSHKLGEGINPHLELSYARSTSPKTWERG